MVRRHIVIALDAEPPVTMKADRGELEIILNNLVSNAVKYNRDAGSVRVAVRREGAAVVVAVSDTGIGMTKDDAARLFGEFVRIKTEKTRDILGSGLGLSIVRKLAILYGGGVMIGIPGQTCDDLASDIETFRALDLDMIGVGPFLPHPATPLGQVGLAQPGATACSQAVLPGAEEGHGLQATRGTLGAEQAPNTELMTYKVVALARLACPGANIPSTTALATLNRASGRELGLQRGANVVMPNLTPPEYRAMYEIYPAKACLYEAAGDCDVCLKRRIAAMGRRVGVGPGASRRASIAPGVFTGG